MTSSPATTGAHPAPVRRCTPAIGEVGSLTRATIATQVERAVAALRFDGQPVRGGQLEPSGSGQVEGGTDAVGDRHETIVVTPAAPGHVNPTSAVLAVVDEGRVSP